MLSQCLKRSLQGSGKQAHIADGFEPDAVLLAARLDLAEEFFEQVIEISKLLFASFENVLFGKCPKTDDFDVVLDAELYDILRGLGALVVSEVLGEVLGGRPSAVPVHDESDVHC